MILEFNGEIKNQFPNLRVLTVRFMGVRVERKKEELEQFKREVISDVRDRYELEELKDVDIFREYRDFFWRIGIDPTKIRPASEALTRRVLQGKDLPTINTFVDTYNLASLSSGVPLAAFDFQTLEGDLEMRFAEEGEEFLGIGMDEPSVLEGGEIVISDSGKIIAVYPYRDSEETKISLDTDDVLLMVCGVPGVEGELEDAKETAVDFVTRFCDGDVNNG